MAFHVRDDVVDTKVRAFASKRALGITEAIGVAIDQAERAEAQEEDRVRAAIREIQQRFASYPDTGLKADKAFYDSLNDE